MWILVQLLYFMLPAYIANMAPPLGKNILKFMAVPVDMNKKFRGKPILGSHKTWRGFFLAVAAGMIVFWLQKMAYSIGFFSELSLFDYSGASIAVGALLGFGAMFGDSLKSFFKRQAGIKSGKPWVPFDQIDFSIGAIAFAAPFYFMGWVNAAVIVAVSALGHILINRIGYHLKLRDVKM